jgi:hypothetical protein
MISSSGCMVQSSPSHLQLMKRTAGNFSITYLVRVGYITYRSPLARADRFLQSAWAGLASEKDAEACEAFFSDKDTSKYALVLQQTLGTIRAKAKYIEVGFVLRFVLPLLTWV